MSNPITRKAGEPCLTGTEVSVAEIVRRHVGGEEDWQIANRLGLMTDHVEFALNYHRKRERMRAQRRNDPKRANRLKGKRNKGSGARAEAWIARELGPEWEVRGGSGRPDIVYKPTFHGLDEGRCIQRVESKRRKGADRALRLALMQNNSQALVRSYGQEPGVRQVEPIVVMRWSTWCDLLREAGYVVKPKPAHTAVRETGAA
jgi:uncharacterized protein (DUF433 family)